MPICAARPSSGVSTPRNGCHVSSSGDLSFDRSLAMLGCTSPSERRAPGREWVLPHLRPRTWKSHLKSKGVWPAPELRESGLDQDSVT